MIDKIKQFLTVSEFVIQEEDRAAGLLRKFLLALAIFAVLAFSLASLFWPANASLNLTFMAILLLLVLFFSRLVKRNQYHLVAVLLTASLFLFTTAALFSFQGIRDPGLTGYFVVLILAALLLGGRAAMIYSILIAVALSGVYFAERQGMVVYTMAPLPNIVDLLILVIATMFMAFLLHASMKSTARSYQAVRQREQELSQLVTELRATTLSKAFVDNIMDSMADMLAVISPSGEIRKVNHSLLATFGYREEELLGRDVDMLLTEVSAETLEMADLWRKKGDIDKIEAVCRTRDGRHIPVSFSSSLMREENGQVQGFVIVAQDITMRKKAEKELRRAKEAAEAAARVKSEFLANTSHEIRTPLNAVIGMTGLMLDTTLTPEQREFVETIRSSSDTLLTVINDILDFSKIEAGKLELEEHPFDPRRSIEESLDLLAPKAAEKGLEMAYYVDKQVPPAITGDATRLRQILVNLISNAVKFTHEGEIVVSMTASPLQDGRYKLHFAVADTGIGIPKDRLSRLFQPFSQVDSSTTRHYGGTGLGLIICKRLSEMMGGTIWVESEEGQGSTFHFTIVANSSDGPPRRYLRKKQPQLAGKRVLIVDDHKTNRRILTHQTQGWGMIPHAVSSGLEALELIQQRNDFDVAILDMQMPEMDGHTLAAKIQQDDRAQNLPLIMMTSLGRRIGKDSTVVYAAYLTKPVKASQLYNLFLALFAEQDELDAEQDKLDAQLYYVSRFLPQNSPFDSEMGQRHPLRILLAEDNVVNQKVALRMLQRMGYRADVAANGLEVLEALQRQQYDVVLMDVQMPEMDGVEATRRIRKQWPAAQQPRVIAMTANALKGDRELYLESGMDDYISKPIHINRLIELLARCPANDDLPKPSTPLPGNAEASNSRTSHEAWPIDMAAVEEMMGGNGAEMLDELLPIFFEDAPANLQKLRQALEAEDRALLKRAAHTLKGNSAGLGMFSLSALCKRLESVALAAEPAEIEKMIAQIESEFNQIETALKQS